MKETWPNERGQAFSYDFFIAFFIFMILINAMYLTWNDHISRVQELKQTERIRFAASSIADNLTLSPGLPGNWEHGFDTNFYGLVEDKYHLAQDKLDAFAAKDYQGVKDALNINEFEFLVTVLQDGNTVYSYGQGHGNPARVIGVERVVTYDGRLAKFSLKLYQQ